MEEGEPAEKRKKERRKEKKKKRKKGKERKKREERKREKKEEVCIFYFGLLILVLRLENIQIFILFFVIDDSCIANVLTDNMCLFGIKVLSMLVNLEDNMCLFGTVFERAS